MIRIDPPQTLTTGTVYHIVKELLVKSFKDGNPVSRIELHPDVWQDLADILKSHGCCPQMAGGRPCLSLVTITGPVGIYPNKDEPYISLHAHDQ